MNNDSDRDGNSSGDLIVEPTVPTGDRAVAIGEQSATTPGTRAADLGVLQHFQTALVNLISEASKIGLSLPIGLGVSSPYELTTPGIHPPEGYNRKFTLQPLMLKQDNPLRRLLRTTLKILKGGNKGREKV